MKHKFVLTAAALVCTATFAQAPPGVVPRPSQETNPTAAGGTPAVKAETKVEGKKGTTPMAGDSTSGTSTMGIKAMDTNGDGMISKQEWDAYHAGMWGRMKSKNGMMPIADVEAAMKGGPN
jgi:hypothetical protein